MAFNVHDATLTSRTETGPPEMICITTSFQITMTRTEALAQPGVAQATLTMQHWDEDSLTGDDMIAQPDDSMLDLSIMIMVLTADPNAVEHTSAFSREDCIEKEDAHGASGEEEIDWYVKIYVDWGTEWDWAHTPVKVVKL